MRLKQLFTLKILAIAVGLTITLSCATTDKPVANKLPLQVAADSTTNIPNTSDFSENKLLGSWGARYSSTNGDGYYNEYIIFKKSEQKIEAIRWSVAKCNRCKTAQDRKPYISDFPKSTTAENGEKLITQMKLHFKSNQLIEIGNSPLGEDIVFEQKPKFILDPFIADCNSGKHPACYYLGEMLLIDGKHSKAIRYWKKACSNGIKEACVRF